MPDARSNFESLPPMQKVMAIIFFVIAVVVIYQVIGIFRNKTHKQTEIAAKAPSAELSKSEPVSQPAAIAPKSAGAEKSPVAAPKALPNAVSVQTAKPLPENASPPPTPYMVEQEKQQGNHLRTLNELQVLKLQREMAETNQAIMAAKLATVTAEKNISDLLTPSGTPGAEQAPTSTTLAPTMGLQGLGAGGGYVVQSVTMEQDQWHAVLNYQEKYYTVTVGDTLPPDGSVVTAIDQKGVTLQQGGVEQRIPLTATDTAPGSSNRQMPMPQAPAAP